MTNDDIQTLMRDKFLGKVVATRGIGSGVNVGRCTAIFGTNIVLEAGSFFMREWKYSDRSHGAFHSLSAADVHGGEVTKVKHDTIITDLAQAVVCDEKIMDIVDKFASKS